MRVPAAALLVTLALAACKSEPQLDSGLPPDKPASELSADEHTDLCEAYLDYYDARVTPAELTRMFCTIGAIGDSIDQPDPTAKCAELRDACLAMPEDELSDEARCDADGDLATCTATVAEVETCFRDMVAALERALDVITCDLADPARVDDVPSDLQGLPQSCMAIAELCPGLLGSGEDVEVGGEA